MTQADLVHAILVCLIIVAQGLVARDALKGD